MELTYSSAKSPAEIIKYLTDMESYVTVSPVVYKIKPLKTNEYLFFEKLRILFLPLKFKYHTTIEHTPSTNLVIQQATVMRFTKIKLEFKVEVQAQKTVITETVTFKTMLPIKFLLRKIFRKQHVLLFQNIEKK